MTDYYKILGVSKNYEGVVLAGGTLNDGERYYLGLVEKMQSGGQLSPEEMIFLNRFDGVNQMRKTFDETELALRQRLKFNFCNSGALKAGHSGKIT